jgi:hypothetical protein
MIVKKFTAFYAAPRLIAAFKIVPSSVPILSQINPVHALLCPIS